MKLRFCNILGAESPDTNPGGLVVSVPPSGTEATSNLAQEIPMNKGYVNSRKSTPMVRRQYIVVYISSWLYYLKSTCILEPCRLKLIKVIGQGGFGTVYLASWRGSLVAAKVISVSQKDIQGCMKEIDILG